MKVLDHLEEAIIALLMAGATLLIFASVVHRYLATCPIPHLQDWLIALNFSWAQELCIYMFVWMAKFGAAYGVRVGIHVGVDVLVNRLPTGWKRVAVLIALVGGAFFTGVVGTLGVRFVWENGMHYAVFHLLGWNTGDLPEGPITPDLEWPTWIIYSCVPLGSYLMSFRFLQVLVWYFRTGQLPAHDQAHVEGLEDVAPLVPPGPGGPGAAPAAPSPGGNS
ncbi:MAG: TRAP transporter small permease, partial [Opitutales bacterium]